MPDRKRPGLKGVYIELPEAMYDDVKALAARNGRTFKKEVVRALERYLQAPETVTTPADPPPPEPAKPAPKKPRKKKGSDS